MATIRALWGSGGRSVVTRESPYFPLRNALSDTAAYRGKWPGRSESEPHPTACCVPRSLWRWAISSASRTGHRTGPNGWKSLAAASDAGRDRCPSFPPWSCRWSPGRSRDDVDEALSELPRRTGCGLPMTTSDVMVRSTRWGPGSGGAGSDAIQHG